MSTITAPNNGGMPPSPVNNGSANTNNMNPNNSATSNKRGASGTATATLPAIGMASSPSPTPQLCASCDRCRARKTKCDGSRPCGNCVTRYKKVNKCDSIEGIDFATFDCIYSPAKRRGPVPGRSSQARANANRNAAPAAAAAKPGYYDANPTFPSEAFTTGLSDGMFSLGLDGGVSSGPAGGQVHMDTNGTFSTDELKQMLALQQQLLVQQQQMQQQQQQQGMMQHLATMPGNNALQQGVINAMAPNNTAPGMPIMGASNNFNGTGNVVDLTSSNMGSNGNSAIPTSFMTNNGIATDGNNGLINQNNNFQNFEGQQQQPFLQQQQGMGMMPNQMSMNPNQTMEDRSAKRAHRTGTVETTHGLPDSVAAHLPFLQLNNSEGSKLRSYYELSTNDVLNLPPIPTDEEYCHRLNSLPDYNHCMPTNLPAYDQSALHAARFSELALGALANNQVPLALELSNAGVMCLRNCIEEPSHKSCMYDVARAYLLHGIFRSFRGDSVRYFKYRRVCMTHILQLDSEPRVDALLAAISFHDAWAYMMHNGAEDALPDIDGSLPRLNSDNCHTTGIPDSVDEIKAKYGCCTNPTSVASDPLNQMWMQGSPPVFLNNEASPTSRSLDAFACAVRTCCDQANTNFADMAKASGMGGQSDFNGQPGQTATTTAVMANENELCSRNIVLSAKSLLDQHAGSSGEKTKKHGLTMIAAAMSAFLADGEENGGNNGSSSGGNVGPFTDGQIKNLMTACDIIIQHPLLLHAPGPIYHMASNATILLCHLLNAIYANCTKEGSSGIPSKVEGVLFDELLDTFMTMRKLLNIHRKSLPVKLRCHGIPRPAVGPFKHLGPNKPFIELGETLMCLCRGCQGFVLMGCSPCVAAERSMKSANVRDIQDERLDSFDNQFGNDMGNMEDLDDNALLDVLSRLTQN